MSRTRGTWGTCHLCGQDRFLCMDHAHTMPGSNQHLQSDGPIRGALCFGCNGRIGWFEKNRDAILGWTDYSTPIGQLYSEYKSKQDTANTLAWQRANRERSNTNRRRSFKRHRPISSRDESFYNLAIKVAEDSDCSDRHGAVIVKGSRVLSVAVNIMSTDRTSALWSKESMHAEQRAIKRVQVRGTTCYTARAHEQDTSRPCAMCWSLLAEGGVERVVYSAGDGALVGEVTF